MSTILGKILKWFFRLTLLLVVLFILLVIFFVRYNQPIPSKRETIRFFHTNQESLQKIADLVLYSDLFKVRKMSFIPYSTFYSIEYKNQENDVRIVDIHTPAFNEDQYWECEDAKILIEKVSKEARVSREDFDWLLKFVKSQRQIFVLEYNKEEYHYVEILRTPSCGFYYEPLEERRDLNRIQQYVRELFVDLGDGWYLAEFSY